MRSRRLFGLTILSKEAWTKKSSALTLRRVVGLGFLASIGFTMSMFISTLAFADATMLMQAKLGIFAASIAGGVVGYKLLKV